MDALLPLVRRIRLVVFDFDGVFTDNRVLVLEDGREAVVCNRADGVGLKRLRELGVEMLVLSQEVNPVVGARCRKLGLEAIQGCEDKRSRLLEICRQRHIDAAQTAYLGNDINDLGCLHMVGLPACVADAFPQVKSACRWQSTRAGGDGAVREFCEFLADAMSLLHQTVA